MKAMADLEALWIELVDFGGHLIPDFLKKKCIFEDERVPCPFSFHPSKGCIAADSV